MGCGVSKQVDDANTIQSDFKELSIPKFNEFFDNVKIVLEMCEEIREGLQDNREDAIQGTDVDWLQEVKFLEAVRVFLWSISSSNEGNINKAGITTKESSPYFDLDRTNLYVEQVLVLEDIQKFLAAITTGIPKIPDIVKKLEDAVTEGKEMAKTIKEEAKNANLPKTKILGEMSAMAANMSKLGKNCVKVKNLPEIAKIGTSDLAELLKNIRELINNADEIGAKAHAEKIFKPKEIFHKFHQGPKKTKDEKEKADKKEGRKSSGKDHGTNKVQEKKKKTDEKKNDHIKIEQNNLEGDIL